MTYTTEKVAEALDELRGYMRCAEIAKHSAAAYRDSNGKTWLLEFQHLRTVLDALVAVTAERDAALAKAWDEGMAYGVNYDAGDCEVAPEPIENPHRRSEVPEPQGEPADALNLDYLETVAKAATPGPWEADDNMPFSEELQGIFAPREKRYVIKADLDQPPANTADADFIAAADPTTVLALIAALRAAGGVR